MDEDTEALIRRLKSNIKLSGRYYILFGLWGSLRIFLEITLNKELYHEIFPPEVLAEYDIWLVRLVMVLFFAVIFFIMMSLHLFIGMGAIRYCKGRSRKKTFAYAALLMSVIIFTGIVSRFIGPEKLTPSAVGSILLDVTVIFLLMDMVYSTFKMHRLLNAEVK